MSTDKILITEFSMLNTSTPPEFYGNSGKKTKIKVKECKIKCYLAEQSRHTNLIKKFSTYACIYLGKDGKNIVANFKKRVRVENIKQSEDLMTMEFDMIGVDAAFANSIRRIMISDVPSMAIEKVFIYNNTSIIQDEILSHRLGLVPLKADPRLFQMKPTSISTEGLLHNNIPKYAYVLHMFI